jgi:hypothetical protein
LRGSDAELSTPLKKGEIGQQAGQQTIEGGQRGDAALSKARRPSTAGLMSSD